MSNLAILLGLFGFAVLVYVIVARRRDVVRKRSTEDVYPIVGGGAWPPAHYPNSRANRSGR